MVSDLPKPRKPKAWLLWVGGGSVVAVAYVVYKRKSSASSTATATTTDTSTDSTIDPSTGIPYSEEDYGYSSGYSAAGADGTAVGSPYGYYSPTGQVTSTPSTNAAWAQAAESTLTTLGYDPIAVSAALGKYLLGAELSQDQYGIVQAALGQEGYPPVPVPSPVVAPPTGQANTNPAPNGSVVGKGQTVQNNISAVIRNYVSHNAPQEAQGASDVYNSFNPNSAMTTNHNNAQLIVNNYKNHGAPFAKQATGATAALAVIPSS